MPWTQNGDLVVGGFTVSEVQYPANVLAIWPREDLEALGLIWVEPEPVPPVIPNRISAMQARLALHGAGLLAAVEAWAADPTTDTAARLYWTHASHLHRNHDLVASIGALLDLSEAQIDDLFIAAAAIT